MSKEDARNRNRFHTIVALHHLRQVVPDLVPRQSVTIYTDALKMAEMLDIELGPLSGVVSLNVEREG